MTQFFDTILARPWMTVSAFTIIGAALAFVGLGTPSAVVFMLAGVLVMYLSGGPSQAEEENPEAG